METSLGENFEELLIKFKTLVLVICVGEGWSNFKTLIPLGFLSNSLNKDGSNDNKKMMLQEIGLDKLQITQWVKTLIWSDEILLQHLWSSNFEWLIDVIEISWEMRDPCDSKDPREERMRLSLSNLSIQSTSKAWGRLENQSTLILSQSMNAMQYDDYDET